MPTESLPPHASLNQLKNQAKDLHKAHKSGDPQVCLRIRSNFPKLSESNNETILSSHFVLQDAQLVVAREYGYESWSRLRSALSEMLLPDFLAAVREDALERAGSLLRDFPEYANVRVKGGCWSLDPDKGDTDTHTYATLYPDKGNTHTCAPIHYCAVKGRAQMAKLLLEAGADPNTLGFEGSNSPDDTGYMLPIVLTGWEGNLETMTVLLAYGADPNGQNGAAMLKALGHQNYDKCRLLIEHNYTVDLATAVGLGMIDKVKSLLRQQTPYDDGAFEEVIRQNQVEAMKLMVAAGHMGDIERPTYPADYTPLQLAASKCAADAVAHLIELGADINRVKPESKHGWDVTGTALHVACISADDPEAVRIVQMLVKAGADTSIRNADGKTAAEIAISAGRNDLAAALAVDPAVDPSDSGPDN